MIEVLVVVAIIALLISILLPSLSKARNQARISVCFANLKQIGTATSTYQGEYRGFVPVVYSYPPVLLGHTRDSHFPPAKSMLLSVALRKYDGMRRQFPPPFDSDVYWDPNLVLNYEGQLMPDFYACPFVRGKPTSEITTEEVDISGTTYTHYIWRNRHESYQTWRFEGNVVRRAIPYSANGPSGGDVYPTDPNPGGPVAEDVDGRPKYSALSWNRAIPKNGTWGWEPLKGFIPLNSREAEARVNRLHRQWSIGDARRLKAASLSEVTVVFCAIGEHMGRNYRIRNMGSHARGRRGGTSALFADTHVEWIPGRQIGWN